jgi:sugar phosphate isomerase/epimerase
MKFAVFTVSMPDYSPEEAARILQEIGYDGVEWRVTDQGPSLTGAPGFWAGNRCTWPLSTFVNDVPRIRQLSEQHQLAIPSLGTYVTCDDPASVQIAMQGAAALNVPQLRVGAPRFDAKGSYLRQRDNAIAQYRDVEAMAKQHKLRAIIEIHMNSLIPSASAAAYFAGHFDPRYVGVIHDAGNMVYEGFEQYPISLALLGPYLAHVHLKNAQWQTTGTRADGSMEWKCNAAPIQKGIVDFSSLIKALGQIGYEGWLSFEDFSTEVPLEQRLRDNLQYLRRVAGMPEIPSVQPSLVEKEGEKETRADSPSQEGMPAEGLERI